jgi:hypothetical protein
MIYGSRLELAIETVVYYWLTSIYAGAKAFRNIWLKEVMESREISKDMLDLNHINRNCLFQCYILWV